MSDLGLKGTDFKSDQELRWCPGRRGYATLAAVRRFTPELGVARKNTFVSGIGWSSRSRRYLQTYGIESIHGRAPAVATGGPPRAGICRSGW